MRSQSRCHLIDQTFLHHVDGELDGGGTGSLAGPGLKHVEA